MPNRPGRKSAAQTPAPKSDRIYGSSKNAAKSASSESSASGITLSSKIIKALENKLEKFKETHDTKKVSLRDLKAVYRRGLGAYSKSHRPTITGGVPNSRNAWAMARVNKFLQKAAGEKVKAAYVQDDDLLKYEDGGQVLTKEEKDLFKYLIENWQEPFYRNQMDAQDIRKYEKLVKKGLIIKGGYDNKVKQYYSDNAIDNIELAYKLVNELDLEETIGGGKIIRAYNYRKKTMAEGGPIKEKYYAIFYEKNGDEEDTETIIHYTKRPTINEIKKLAKYFNAKYVELYLKGLTHTDDFLEEQIYLDDRKMDNGGEVDIIQLPDVQSSEESLKRVLEMQGYKLEKEYKKGGETESEKELHEIYKIQKMQELQKTMEYGGVMARGGKTPKGDCYVAAGDIVMDYLLNQRGFGAYRSEFEFHGTPYLVHAEVAGQGHLEGVRYGHAWIEDDNLVYDYSNGRKIVFPKQLYYSIGDIDEDNPMKYQKYTFEEAKNRMMKTGNYGCWDIDVEFADGGSVIGDRKISDVRIVNTDSDAKVYATYEDGYEEVVFDYYPDEIEFSTTELIGLTVDQANELKDEKQQQYNMYSNSAAEFKHGGVADSDEVVCVNCDWEWNKANSDKEHMYNCHKCGFDNTMFYTVFKETMTLEQIAEKHGVDMDYLQAQFEEGAKHEMDEHTKVGTNLSREVGETIALHHLEESPDYYEKIKSIEYENGGDISSKEQYLEALLTEAFDLLDAHVNFGGVLEYSDKEYGYLNDEVEDVQVGYFKDEDLDSSYAEELREKGFTMDLDEAIETLEHRLSSIDEEMKELFGKEYSTRWDNFKKNNKYEKGGKAEDCGCGSKSIIGNYEFAKGGLAYGNSHDKGGMPMKVGSTGQNIEIEGGEGVINKRSMQMTKKVEFEGKMMTPCEVISKINEMGGGVKFDCSDVKEIIEKDGEF